MSYLKNFFKGIVVGVATLVPGVSGGTMAIVLGIYDRLIHSVGSFFEDWKKNFFFLFQVGAGGLLGILLFDRMMLSALEVAPYVMQFLFIGIIIGGLPVLYKRAMSSELTGTAEKAGTAGRAGSAATAATAGTVGRTGSAGTATAAGTGTTAAAPATKAGTAGRAGSMTQPTTANKASKTGSIDRPNVSDIIFLIIGIAIVLLMTSKPDAVINLATGNTFLSYIFLIIAGVILAVALVLPGISFSFMLLALGMYDITLKAIKDLNIPYLIPLGLGVAIGTFGTARILEKLLQKHPRKTYMIIIGFVLGSLVEVFPGIPIGWQLPVSAAVFVAGFIAMLWLGKKGITD